MKPTKPALFLLLCLSYLCSTGCSEKEDIVLPPPPAIADEAVSEPAAPLAPPPHPGQRLAYPSPQKKPPKSP